MRAPRKGSVWSFEPVLFDRAQDNTRDIRPWTLVRVIQPHGCPKNGTMSMCYVEHADDSTFIGLVCINSLAKPRSLYRIVQQGFGQWIGYKGQARVKWFYDDQKIGGKTGEQQAREWLATTQEGKNNHDIQS